jgi:hypothetical protein
MVLGGRGLAGRLGDAPPYAGSFRALNRDAMSFPL